MFEKIYETLKEEKEISVAAIEGGMKIIEVTMSVPNAPKLIKELKEAYKGTCVGAGTVLTKDAVDECVKEYCVEVIRSVKNI